LAREKTCEEGASWEKRLKWGEKKDGSDEVLMEEKESGEGVAVYRSICT